eukprot:TRINITY_DN23437_c0_g1_i4.p1 TRINITY_DN23437_c0_g1~~TRINITY_DN23437_c0_g1_i4.p1  ORF type:complete len:115 (+),score=23.97 TRINITY_DN23437_c0_g1_i4:201-545(+)
MPIKELLGLADTVALNNANGGATESESWMQLGIFLSKHVERWADGRRPDVSEMSEGHSLVYVVATENGKKGTRDLYNLFIETLNGVTHGKRKEAIYQRFKKVATPLTNLSLIHI